MDEENFETIEESAARILRSWAMNDTPSGAYDGRLLTPRGHAEWKGADIIERLLKENAELREKLLLPSPF